MADAGQLRISSTDVIFSCVDSDLARVAIYAGRGHACYACQLMPAVRARLLAEHFQRRYSCAAGNMGPPASPISGTPALASIIGSLQVDRAVRHLARPEPGRTSGSVELRLDDDAALMSLRVGCDPVCPFHAFAGAQVPVTSANTLFVDILKRAGAPDGAVVLDWPVCVLARCSGCGRAWAPNRRLGLLRAGAGCPRCGARGWVALETVSEVAAGSAYVRKPISVFGLPADHIFNVI
jgi:hypothetical protein